MVPLIKYSGGEESERRQWYEREKLFFVSDRPARSLNGGDFCTRNDEANIMGRMCRVTSTKH